MMDSNHIKELARKTRERQQATSPLAGAATGGTGGASRTGTHAWLQARKVKDRLGRERDTRGVRRDDKVAQAARRVAQQRRERAL